MMRVGGIDPGTRYCGAAVVEDGHLLAADRWTLPPDLTQACVLLHAQVRALVERWKLEALAVEDFHFQQQRGSMTTAKAMYGLLGVVRGMDGYKGVRVVPVQAGLWGQHFTGVKPSRVDTLGRRSNEWKRTVAWYVEREAGPGWDWTDDPGYHMRDAVGAAFYLAHVLRMEALTRKVR
jgi:hypothetical protein